MAGDYPLTQTLVIFGTVEIYGAHADTTILRQVGIPGSQAGSMNSMIKVPGISLKLDHVTLRDGYSYYAGGAIALENEAATLTVTNARFLNNRVHQPPEGLGMGGAIYSGGTFSLEKVYFQDNVAPWGGAVASYAPPNGAYRGILKYVDFKDNFGAYNAGAVYIGVGKGDLKIRQSNFRQNASNVLPPAAIPQHAFSHTPEIGIINAKKNYWNNPSVPSSATNEYGVNTLEQLASKVTFEFDPPALVPSCGARGRQVCSPTSTPTPTPTATPDPIAELLAYGISIVSSDPPAPQWTYTELLQIRNSVVSIGNAFTLMNSNLTPIDNFREIMEVNDYGNISFKRTDDPFCVYLLAIRQVQCGNLEDADGSPRIITEFVITHELGHVFNVSTARNQQKPLSTYVNETSLQATAIITDVRGPVMGNFVQDDGDIVWRRGERGWGSGPGSEYDPNDDRNGEPIKKMFSDYQQNTAPYVPTVGDPRTPHEIAVDETAADMFLNWVYRSSVAAYGFSNTSWKPTDLDPASGMSCSSSIGCPESNPAIPFQTLLGESGDARMAWMNEKMGEIFDAQGWR